MITLEDIITQWEKDCQIDNLNLDESTLKFAKIHAKYLAIVSEARLMVKKLKSDMDKLRQEKWLYYSGKMTQAEMDDRKWPYDPFNGTTKPMRSDLDRYIDVDSDVSKLQLRIDYNEEIVLAVTEIIDTLRWRHQAVRNALDWKKFTAGA